MPEQVSVDLAERSYEIYVGANLLEQAHTYIDPFLVRSRVAIITDENVAKYHLATLQMALAQNQVKSEVLTLPAGETTKSWPFLMQTVEWLLEQKFERRDLVIALGGALLVIWWALRLHHAQGHSICANTNLTLGSSG